MKHPEYWNALREALRQRDSGPLPEDFSAGCSGRLSLSQERLWKVEGLFSDRHCFNLPMAIRIEGSFVLAEFKAAFAELLSRQTVLRMVVDVASEVPSFSEDVELTRYWTDFDLSSCPMSDQEEAIERHIAETQGEAFDLELGPLFRVRSLMLSAESHVVIFVLHQLIFDQWSQSILMNELWEFYGARIESREPALPALTWQFKDYARWQRNILESDETLGKLVSYWRKEFEGCPPKPLEFPRRLKGDQGRRRRRGVSFELSSSRSHDIRVRAGDCGVTLFTFLYAAFCVLIHDALGGTEVTIRCPFSNRPREEFQQLIGYFVNLILLRCRFDGGPTFAELLDRARRTVADATAHQNLPFHLLSCFDSGEVPRTQIMFSLMNAPQWKGPGNPLQVEPLDVLAAEIDCDLYMTVSQERDRLRCCLQFDERKLDTRMAEGLADGFQSILSKAVAAPGTPVTELGPFSGCSPFRSMARQGHTVPQSVDCDRPDRPDRESDSHSATRLARRSTLEQVVSRIREVLRFDEVPEDSSLEASVEPKRGRMSDADRACVTRTLAEILGIEPERLQGGLTLYELGMDSLRMIRLVDEIQKEIGGGLSLQQLGGDTTLAELVESVGTLRNGDGIDRLPQLISRPQESTEPFPLTDIQQAYWIGRDESFELGNVSPHAYLEIDGADLDLDRLSRALQVVIGRHSMLRTVVDESGRQHELTEVAPYWIREQGPSGEVALEDYLRALREEMARGIQSPETWPLFDLRATRLDERVIRLHISIDLVMLDLASVLRMFDEWHQLYREPDRSLPALELTFRDYVIAAETIERSELYRRSERYWLARLDSLAASPDLPLKCPPRDVVQPRFRRREEILDAADWEGLKCRARQRGVTPSSLLVTVYAEVLACWAKGDSFTINTTLFHRLPLHQQIGEIIGDFTSLIPLEVDLSGSHSFEERVREIHGQLLKDLDHRYFSGVRVLREWAKRRRRMGGALLPVVFTSALSLESMGLSADVLSRFGKLVYCVGHTPQVYLDFQIYDHEGGLKLVWDAVDEVFPEGMLDDMFAALCLRIKELAASDSNWVESSPCLVPRTQLDQRREIHDTDRTFPIRCLHTGFLEKALRSPESLAVATLEKQLTYGELRKRSLALCSELREKGIRPNQVVGVMLEKGWEQVVAVMGILMSGGAYLPVDLSLPAARQRYLLENGEVTIVVCRDGHRGDLEWPGCVLHWCSLAGEPAGAAEPSPKIANEPSDSAYVIYTSGSTGEPKGVMVEHRSAMNTILDVGDRFGLKDSDRVLGLSSLSFDLSVFDIFGTLGCGAALILPDADRRKDPVHWLELMNRFDVSVWNSVPMLLQMFVDSLAGRIGELSPTLRLALLSGDWIPLALPDRLRDLWPDLEVIGLGGATEASIWSNFFPIGEVQKEWSSIPYGKPLSNQRLHVLTPELEACPIWVEGEIFIEGSGLARSYWRDEDKTARAFITEPRSGRRLYRTGDLGRFLPDGNIEILGRNDLQVKVQGYRIELGEIESVLLAHEKVEQAVVLVQGQRTETPKLHAVVVMSGESHSGDEGETTEGGVVRASARFPCLPQGLPETGLPLLESDRGDEDDGALSRRTCRQFASEEIPLLQLSRLLQCLRPRSLSQAGGLKYRYPSAGSLYPVEVYLSVRSDRMEGLEAGIYFYAAKEHRLIQLGKEMVEERASHFEANRGVFDQSAFSLFLVAQMDAIEPIYGDLARDFCLIEVGSMLQELMLRASGVGLGLCPVGWLDSGLLRSALRLGPRQELLHTVIGGAEPIGGKSLQERIAPPSVVRGDDRELIAYLEKRLPAYMIPESIQIRERLELDSNGKVNRTSLARSISPMASDRRQEKMRDSRAPMEREVAEIWERILGIRKVGNSENFFFLGGNSLMATRVIAQIRMKFKVELPLRDMFANPTVAYTASVISRKLEELSDDGELIRLLDGLEGMSDDEVRDELAKQRRKPSDEGESSGL